MDNNVENHGGGSSSPEINNNSALIMDNNNVENHGGGSSSPESNKNSNNSSGQQLKTNLIVNYLPETMKQRDMRSLFLSQGEIESCKLMHDDITRKSLCYGFVNYYSEANAQNAIQNLNGLKICNKTIKVSYARSSSHGIKGANLYVSGIPKHMSQVELESLFAPYGDIIASRILTENATFPYMESHSCENRNTSLSRGVGFVRFNQKREAERAINNLNGTKPTGFNTPLTVKFAYTPRREQNIPNFRLPSLGTFLTRPPSLQLTTRYLPTPVAAAVNPFSNRMRSPQIGSLSTAVRGNNAAILKRSAGIQGAQVISPHGIDSYTLFVYNLVPETQDQCLWQLFGPFGAVQNVSVIRDPQSGNCKGFGFVKMTNYDDAVVAIQSLNGYRYENRVLQVSFKTNK